MSYTRTLESGNYIWPDNENINFNDKMISNDEIDIFLFKLFNFRKQEFVDRIENGKNIISEFLQNRLDNDKESFNSQEEMQNIKNYLEEIRHKSYMIYESNNDPSGKNIETFIDLRSSLNEIAIFFGTTFQELIKLTTNNEKFKSLSKGEKENEINQIKEIINLINKNILKDLDNSCEASE